MTRLDAEQARAVAAAVPDPELPMITIGDLGILRNVAVHDDGSVEVSITPTYSGCPAMAAITGDVQQALRGAGAPTVVVRQVLAPAWSTDDITANGRAVLAEHGIAPPGPAGPTALRLAVRCPHCGSPDTEETSRFSSTACKALWRCRACREPFEHVKAL